MAAGCATARGGVIQAMEYSESCAIFLLFLPLPLGPLHVLLPCLLELYTTSCCWLGLYITRLLLDGVVHHEAAAGWGCTPRGGCWMGLYTTGYCWMGLYTTGCCWMGSYTTGCCWMGLYTRRLLLDGVVHHDAAAWGKASSKMIGRRESWIGGKEGIVVSRK